jgi:hypothetical protein
MRNLVQSSMKNSSAEGSRVSSVGIAIGYSLDDGVSKVQFRQGLGNFPLHHRVQTGSGGPPSFLFNEYWGDRSLGVKRPGLKLTTHLHLVPRLKSEWRLHPLLQLVFMAFLVTHRENFIFTIHNWLSSFLRAK